MSKSYTTTVQTDDSGELYIIIPPELLDSLQWAIDDELEMTVDDGIITLQKK